MTDYKVLPGILRALQRGEIDSARYIMASYADETRQEIEALLQPAVEPIPDHNAVFQIHTREGDPAEVAVGHWSLHESGSASTIRVCDDVAGGPLTPIKACDLEVAITALVNRSLGMKSSDLLVHPTQAEEDAASLTKARADGTAEKAVDELLKILESPQRT